MAIPVPVVGDKATAAWADAVAALLNDPNLGENIAGASVTLASVATAVASTTSVTFTLAAQTRVRIKTQCIFVMASGTSGHYTLRAGYNAGASAAIGSAIGVSQTAHKTLTLATNGSDTAYTEGSVLLAAGQYTAYAIVTRTANGTATDLAGTFMVAVIAEGSV